MKARIQLREGDNGGGDEVIESILRKFGSEIWACCDHSCDRSKR